MDKNRSEVYGTFTYAESLTYYDLLETENTLKENLDKLFLGAGAEHLDFTPLGIAAQGAGEYACSHGQVRGQVMERGEDPKKLAGHNL